MSWHTCLNCCSQIHVGNHSQRPDSILYSCAWILQGHWHFLSNEGEMDSSSSSCFTSKTTACKFLDKPDTRVQERHEHTGGKSSKWLQRWLRDQSIWNTRRGWELWDCSAWEREGSGGILPMCINKYLMGWWGEKMTDKTLQSCIQWKQRRQGAQIETQEIPFKCKQKHLLL